MKRIDFNCREVNKIKPKGPFLFLMQKEHEIESTKILSKTKPKKIILNRIGVLHFSYCHLQA